MHMQQQKLEQARRYQEPAGTFEEWDCGQHAAAAEGKNEQGTMSDTMMSMSNNINVRYNVR